MIHTAIHTDSGLPELATGLDPSAQAKPCYGTMFPDPLHGGGDGPAKGKVFSYMLFRSLGMIQGGREVRADQVAWQECRQCPLFDDCYQLSMGKIALASAISNR